MTKKKTKLQWVGLAFALLAMAFLFTTLDLTAFADVQTTLKDIETGAGSQFKAIANIGIGIIIILFGGAQFLGAEIKSWAKKLLIGAIVGAIVIVNFDWIRDTFWGWIGG
ncbi:hypothetical protein ACK4CS_12665 [Enterococcus gallinarum]|jgi:hypothetical protein|uniref:Uncharacterized protein n=1 Tax=Enterococcus gallinarum TaxID=1353 RepID=A0AAE4HSA8_ENTGA|nr:hypothetical protein [Enterococcus gallinarum]MBO6420046.1 hypothetical protein [Enterococcus gallinarum]MBO6423043.1 hypothetical protein [Enterococcus gallinarum]MDT2691524.1 hypothetical protein [Enterococcus gallinarum]